MTAPEELGLALGTSRCSKDVCRLKEYSSCTCIGILQAEEAWKSD